MRIFLHDIRRDLSNTIGFLMFLMLLKFIVTSFEDVRPFLERIVNGENNANPRELRTDALRLPQSSW